MRLLTNVNIATWISNMFQVVWLSHSTRIMGRPISSGVTIKIVVRGAPIARIKTWSVALKGTSEFRGSRLLFTRGCHAVNNLTIELSVLPINQTSSSRMTNQPVVDIAFDQDLSAKLFPQGEAYSIEVCFVQRRGCRDRDICYFFDIPIWPWGDCV